MKWRNTVGDRLRVAAYRAPMLFGLMAVVSFVLADRKVAIRPGRLFVVALFALVAIECVPDWF